MKPEMARKQFFWYTVFMQKKLYFVLKVAVTAGLVFWLIKRVDWSGVEGILSHVSWWLLIVALGLQLIGNLLSAKKWQVIVHFKNLKLSLSDAFFTYLTGGFINNFLPSTIGGDAYRGLWLAKRSGARAAALSTVVFDRFIGLWTTAVLAAVFGVFLWRYFLVSFPLLVTMAVIVSFLLVDLVITSLYCLRWFHAFVARIPFHTVRRILEEVMFYTRKHIWLTTGLWSRLFVMVGVAASNFALFHALGSTIEVFPFLSIIFLVTIVSAAPISVNNIGIKEWAYVTFFALVGVNAETAVTVALLSRFLQMLISFIALPQYWRTREHGE